MSARYSALPDLSAQDVDRELDDAFGPEYDDADDENTPLNPGQALLPPPSSRSRVQSPASTPAVYNFEMDYDCPPPGSPPRPTALALPNDIGNSNGYLPSTPVGATAPQLPLFRRLLGSVFPSQYSSVPTNAPPRAVGGGTENDGVFANVMAKPHNVRVVAADGEVHMMPEEVQKEMPPSYSDAQADAVPPYWETTVHTPAGLEPGADMIIDDLPCGSIWIFFVNLFISFFFQFVGFLLSYLLHTTHAAKYGSRAGLGLTLIQYGFYSRAAAAASEQQHQHMMEDDQAIWYLEPASSMTNETITAPTPDDNVNVVDMTTRDWLAFFLMTLGWFLLLSSTVSFFRVKRWERSIQATSAPVPITREDIEREIAVRRNLESVFGIHLDDEDHQIRLDAHGNAIIIPAPEAMEEARLTRDLRAAGLL